MANNNISTNSMIHFHDPFKFVDQMLYGSSTNTITTFTEGYPPYNIREIDEDTRTLELATAGFSKDEISIKIEDDIVTISGEKKASEEETKYIHKGIATRKFSKSVTLWEYWEVNSADYNDGILYVVLKREIPEEKNLPPLISSVPPKLPPCNP